MNKKIRVSLVKKLVAGTLAVGMIVAGIIIVPKQADAEGSATIKNTVIYDESYKIADYWNDGKKAPVKDGYVFGGWFKEDEATTAENKETLASENGQTTKTCVPLDASEIDVNNDGKVDDNIAAVAKFVPAQLLSVKSQNGVEKGKNPITKAEDISETNPMWVRVMTAQDSKNYKTIGFDIRLANIKAPVDSADNDTILESDKVFSQVYVGDTLTEASAIFGSPANFVSVWKLDQINFSGNADKIIYVRPYWKTLDGTKVLGLAKYVHIEDEYKNYISVPINVSRSEDIAAGAVTMTYNSNGWTPLTDDSNNVLFEVGRIFPNMRINHASNTRTIKLVGYEPEVNTNDSSDETIFANIRFKAPDTVADADLEFDITIGRFCDWAEKLIEGMKVWDIAYEVKANTTE